MSTSRPPLVSIVTPFYNTESYLEQCIESVLAQTFTDFEYILVDNHSTDGGRELASSWAQRDPRVRLISPPEFLNQAENFNFALRSISDGSRYCKMVLADDWIYPQCIAEMVQLAEGNPGVGLVSSYNLADTSIWGEGMPVEREVFSGREGARFFLADRLFPFGNQSTVLYRADLVRERQDFFDGRTVFFDTDAALRTLADHDFGFVHQVLSFFRVHPESLTSQTKDYAPQAVDYLIALHNHGSTFLSEEELHDRIAHTEAWVYTGLGRQRLRELRGPRDAEYWAYQQRCLAAAGLELDPGRIWKGAARSVAIDLLSPGDKLRRARRGTSGRARQ